MKSTVRLKRMSLCVYRFGVAVGIVSTTIAVLRWFVIDNPNWLPPTIASYVKPGTLTYMHRLAGFFIELIPLAAALYTLAALHRICTAYCRGEVFGPTSGTCYRKFGTGLVLLGAANGLYTTLVIGAFSLLNEKKEFIIALGLSTADLYLLVVGCAVMMLGIVMDEAYRIHDENAQIV